jgi:hypothetical protein
LPALLASFGPAANSHESIADLLEGEVLFPRWQIPRFNVTAKALLISGVMIEIAIFPRRKMTITIKDGGRHPPYQSKKAPPNEIPENDS